MKKKRKSRSAVVPQMKCRSSERLPTNVRFPDVAEMPCMEIKPLRLTGHIIDLIPLRYGDIPEIEQAARQATIFKYFIDGWIILRLGVAAYVQKLINEEESVAFSVFHKQQKKIIGVTRVYDISKHDHTLSVASWYAKNFHGTGVNTEAKYLLLRYLFTVAHCRRVQFDIDINNTISIAATKSIGATYNGKFPSHLMLADGEQRTSVIYSVTDDSWPKARETMERKLARIYSGKRRPRKHR